MQKPVWIREVALIAGLLSGAGCAGHRAASIKDPGYTAPVNPEISATVVATNPPVVAPPVEIPTPPAEPPPTPSVPGVVKQGPPPPQVEVVRDPPGPDYVWTPGFWDWRGQWIWVSGRWVVGPHPHAAWVPGRWVRRAGGWIWIRGYWR